MGLRKSYGDIEALRGVDLSVATGSVFGLLGPNGAGKTTAVRILTTLVRPDGGSARVSGLDIVRDARRLRERIGLAARAVRPHGDRGAVVWSFVIIAVFGSLSVWRYRRTVSR